VAITKYQNRCPSSGSYEKDEEGSDSVIWAAKDQDSQWESDPSKFDKDGMPIW